MKIKTLADVAAALSACYIILIGLVLPTLVREPLEIGIRQLEDSHQLPAEEARFDRISVSQLSTEDARHALDGVSQFCYLEGLKIALAGFILITAYVASRRTSAHPA